MRINKTFQCLLVVMALAAVVGCVTSSTRRVEDLVTPLPKLTTAVVGVVRYADQAHRIPDEQLVEEAIKDKPELQQAFMGYPIKVRHDASHVVVLVCSPDGKSALLEDSSRTSTKVDHLWYLSVPQPPAEFTMDPTQRSIPSCNPEGRLNQ